MITRLQAESAARIQIAPGMLVMSSWCANNSYFFVFFRNSFVFQPLI